MTLALSNSISGPTCVKKTDNDQPATRAARAQKWLGRGVSVVGSGISSGVSTVSNTFLKAIEKISTAINHWVADSNATAAVFRKLDQHVLDLFAHLKGAKEGFGQFTDFIRRNVAFIDFVQLVGDIDYFVAGRFKEKRNEAGEIEKSRDNNVVIAAKTAFTVADIGGSLLWFQELGFINLSKAAEAIGQAKIFSFVPKAIASIPVLRDLSGLQKVASAIGEFRAFSFVPKLSCLAITLRALDLAYALLAIDATRRLVNADNKNKTISAGLDLSSYLAELLLSALVLAGITNIIGLGVAGAACITLTVASFLYRVTHENELKQLPAKAVAA